MIIRPISVRNFSKILAFILFFIVTGFIIIIQETFADTPHTMNNAGGGDSSMTITEDDCINGAQTVTTSGCTGSTCGSQTTSFDSGGNITSQSSELTLY